MSEPVFAVVGPPNKGKSSIVATLTHNDRIEISSDPGTTRRSNRYPMSIDGRVLYTFVDTPGFERARAVREWLREEGRDAVPHERPAIVRKFVETFSNTGK